MGDMIATFETLLGLLGDLETSHRSPLLLRWTSPIPVPSHSTLINAVSWRRFAARVDSRLTNHGLTAADLQMFVDEIKKHPDISAALLDAVFGEVANLIQGQRFSFDFD